MKLRHLNRALVGLVMLGVVGGCQTASSPARLNAINGAYAQGQYATAYDLATALVDTATGHDRESAAFVAGMSAHKLGSYATARRYLRQASQSSDRLLAADALAQLGLLYAQQGRYVDSARALLRCAPMYNGADRANAYFFAAVAQQKLGRWPQARTNLYLARAASNDAAFHKRVAEQLAVSGYTVQVGAFRQMSNAQAAAKRLAAAANALRLGSPRLIRSADATGRELILVQVGQFAIFTAAQRCRDELGQPHAIIVPLAKRGQGVKGSVKIPNPRSLGTLIPWPLLLQRAAKACQIDAVGVDGNAFRLEQAALGGYPVRETG